MLAHPFREANKKASFRTKRSVGSFTKLHRSPSPSFFVPDTLLACSSHYSNTIKCVLKWWPAAQMDPIKMFPFLPVTLKWFKVWIERRYIGCFQLPLFSLFFQHFCQLTHLLAWLLYNQKIDCNTHYQSS